MSRRFRHDHFHRGPDSSIQEMPAVGGAIAFSNHHMRMKHWVAIVFCNVPGKREDLHLFLYWNFLVALRFTIKETKCHFTKSTNGNELCSSQPIFSGKSQQRLF